MDYLYTVCFHSAYLLSALHICRSVEGSNSFSSPLASCSSVPSPPPHSSHGASALSSCNFTSPFPPLLTVHHVALLVTNPLSLDFSLLAWSPQELLGAIPHPLPKTSEMALSPHLTCRLGSLHNSKEISVSSIYYLFIAATCFATW